MKSHKQWVLSLVALATSILSCHSQESRNQVGPTRSSPAVERNPHSWKEFHSPQGRFTILFPGTPTDVDKSFDTAMGRLDAREFKLITSAGYIVTYTDFPVDLENDPGKLDQTLNRVRDRATAEVKGTVLNESGVSIASHPGRMWKVAIPGGGFIRVRVYVVRQRLYQIAITTPEEKVSPDGGRFDEMRAAKFLDSFKLVKPENERDVNQ
jgi:hypothetical protein